MIDKLTYDDILKVIESLKKNTEIIKKLAASRKIGDLNDFIATVEGYSKFLETTIEMNKDADMALADLQNNLKRP